MTATKDEIEARVQVERVRLLEVLAGLDADGWRTPSLCAGWSVRDLVVHVLMPYEASTPRFLLAMLRARFDFDRAADRWARGDRRTPEQLLTALRATAGARFNVPGAPPEGPLSHLVIHAQDVYRPLGVPSPTDPDNARIALGQLLGPRGRGSLVPGLVDGLTFTATDADLRHGAGPEVRGPAAALLTTVAGRTAALTDLTGDGAPVVRTRLQDAARP